MIRGAYRFDSIMDTVAGRLGMDPFDEGTRLVYRIEEGEFWLQSISEDLYELYEEYGQLGNYSAYLPHLSPGASVQIAENDLSLIQMRGEITYAVINGERVDEYRYDDPDLQFAAEFFYPFGE